MQKEHWQTNPQRRAINNELDEHTHRIKELLKGDLIILEQENRELKKKCQQVDELQDKVEMLLNDNAQLVGDNAKLTGLLKKNEAASADHIRRLENDIQNVKNQMTYLQANLKSELDGQRARLESKHSEEMEVMQLQNLKLKEGLQARGRELDQTHMRNAKQKYQYEETINSLRRECDNLKIKFMEMEDLTNKQMADIKNKLTSIYQSEIEELNAVHQNHKKSLQTQIYELQILLKAKSKEASQLETDKNILIDRLDEETKYTAQLEKCKKQWKEAEHSLQDKIMVLERQITDKTDAFERKIKEKDNQIEYLSAFNTKFEAECEKQINSTKALLTEEKKDRELERKTFANREDDLNNKMKEQQNGFRIEKETLLKNFKLTESQLEQNIESLKQQHEAYKKQLKKEANDRQRYIEGLKETKNQEIKDLNSRIRNLEHDLRIAEKECDNLKDTMGNRDKEHRSMEEKIRIAEKRQRRLQNDIEDLREIILKNQTKAQEVINNQKASLENSNQSQLDNLRIDLEAVIRLEKQKNKDLTAKLMNKENELEQVLKMYKKMKQDVYALTQQEANKKEIDLKFPGAKPDLIATKNLFDVFVKSKVIATCEEAIKEKENEF